MGKRGPAPKPTRLRLLHGDRPNRTNQDEPWPAQGMPECPDDATDEVRAVWDYALKNLIVMGVATPADRDTLRVYCEAVVTFRKACTLLAETPIVIPGAATVVVNPAVRVQRDAAAVIRAYAGEFGFTPAARSEISKGAASHRDPSASRYLNA